MLALNTSLPRVNSSLFDETQGISPRVLGIERSLAPRAHHDAACRCLVHVLARQTAQRLRTVERCLEVLDREVQRLCSRVRLTVRGDIQHLQGHGAALEVAPVPGLLPPQDSEQVRIERDRRVEIADLDVEPEELRYIVRRFGLCERRLESLSRLS